MPNIWSKLVYVQDFSYESISFKKYVNMFEHTEITESIYEGVVEPSYKYLHWKMTTVLVTTVTREEKPLHLRPTPRQERYPTSAENDM